MSNSKLPERASLEYLKKLAKDRLRELRRSDSKAKLATALLSVAREYGISSWRELKAELAQRQADYLVQFFEACSSGDIEQSRKFLADDPSLTQATHPNQPHA